MLGYLSPSRALRSKISCSAIAPAKKATFRWLQFRGRVSVPAQPL